MSVSTLKYCSAPLNWNIHLKFVSGQPLAEQYCFNFTWKSVKIEPILFLKISDLDMAVFCFVLFFVGYPGDCVHSVCSAGFFFQVHFWTAISCAEHGNQNCPKLAGGLRGASYGTKPTGKSLRPPWLVSAPESCTCSSSFPVPSALQYLQTPTNTGILTVTLTVLRIFFQRSWGIHTGLKLGLFCIWTHLLLLGITRMSVLTLMCNCGCRDGSQSLQTSRVYAFGQDWLLWQPKKAQCGSSQTFTDKISKDYWADEPKGIFLYEFQTGPSSAELF